MQQSWDFLPFPSPVRTTAFPRGDGSVLLQPFTQAPSQAHPHVSDWGRWAILSSVLGVDGQRRCWTCKTCGPSLESACILLEERTRDSSTVPLLIRTLSMPLQSTASVYQAVFLSAF